MSVGSGRLVETVELLECTVLLSVVIQANVGLARIFLPAWLEAT
jgi:hypothetical protein